MRAFIVSVPVAIHTKDKESCDTDWEFGCRFYHDHECNLFDPGSMLEVSGTGESFRHLRHAACRKATGDE